jgi:RNA polymerase sigma factor (sigma-70 family)
MAPTGPGTFPLVEVPTGDAGRGLGAAPNLQLHLIVPVAYATASKCRRGQETPGGEVTANQECAGPDFGGGIWVKIQFVLSENVLAAEGTATTFEVAERLLGDVVQVRRLVVYAWVRFHLPKEDAEDLLQETLLALCRQNQRVRRPEGFVFQVFHRACVRQTRRSGRDPSGRPACQGRTPVEPAYIPADAGIRIDVRRAFGSLASTCRRILSAYYVEGRSMKEAAGLAEIASSGAMKTIDRCLKKLKQCLQA